MSLTQLENSTKKDWITTVKKDLQDIKVNMELSEIKNKLGLNWAKLSSSWD